MRAVVCRRGKKERMYNLYCSLPWSDEIVLCRIDVEVCGECVKRIGDIFRDIKYNGRD